MFFIATSHLVNSPLFDTSLDESTDGDVLNKAMFQAPRWKLVYKHQFVYSFSSRIDRFLNVLRIP